MIKVDFDLVDENGEYQRTIKFKQPNDLSAWLYANNKIVRGYEIIEGEN